MMYAPMNSRYRPANQTNPPPTAPQAGEKQTDAQANRGNMTQQTAQGNRPQGYEQPLTAAPKQPQMNPLQSGHQTNQAQNGQPQTNQTQSGQPQASIPQNPQPQRQGEPVQYNQQVNQGQNAQPQGSYSQGAPFQNQQNQPRQNQWNQNQGQRPMPPNGQWSQAQNQARMNQMQGNRPMNGMGSGQSPISGLLGKILGIKDPIGSLNKIMSIMKLLG